MLRDLKNNKKGIVLVTVLMITIVMMILAISVISLNVSQVLMTEGEVKRLQAELIAMGALAYTFANQLSDTAGDNIGYTITIENTTFTVSSNVGAATGPNNTNSLNIVVSY